MSKLLVLPLLLACLAACGDPPSLLEAANVDDDVYGEGGAAGAFAVSSKDPADVGTLRGIVKFEGRPYKRTMVPIDKDKFCTNANPDGMMSEQFVFDSATGGLANVMVYIKRGMNMKFDPPSEPLVLDQIGCRYEPHMALIQVGQPLRVKSQDNTLHNVHGISKNNGEFNKTISAPGQLPLMTFDKAEYDAPMLVKCDVHGWMKSYLAVLKHPFCVITGEDGKFELKGVPPGTYELLIFHEYLGSQTLPVTLTKNQTLELEKPIVFTR